MRCRTYDAPRTPRDLHYLTQGHSTSSFGGRCAALNGVPSAIVDRAEAISLLLSRNESISSAFETLRQDEEHNLRVAEDVARRFLQADLAAGDKADERHIDFSTLRSLLCDIVSPWS